MPVINNYYELSFSKLLSKWFDKSPGETKIIFSHAFTNRKFVPSQRPLNSYSYFLHISRPRRMHFTCKQVVLSCLHSHSDAVSVKRGRSLLGSIFTKTYGTVFTRVKMPVRKPFERLPKSVKPKHYKLVLTPDLKAFIFKGEVSIQIQVSNKSIVM